MIKQSNESVTKKKINTKCYKIISNSQSNVIGIVSGSLPYGYSWQLLRQKVIQEKIDQEWIN